MIDDLARLAELVARAMEPRPFLIYDRKPERPYGKQNHRELFPAWNKWCNAYQKVRRARLHAERALTAISREYRLIPASSLPAPWAKAVLDKATREMSQLAAPKTPLTAPRI